MEDYEKIKKIEKVMGDFADLCNSFNIDKEAIFKTFCTEHRTIQQSMFGVFTYILVSISLMATDEYRTDGRNEYSKKVAKMLVEGYAEMEKQNYLKEKELGGYFHSDADKKYYENYAEELKQGILANPMSYLGRMPCI